jgi:hypothetical protein
VKTIELPLSRHAAAVYVYVEGFSEPMGYALTHNDGRGMSLTDQPLIRIRAGDGTLLSQGPRGAALANVGAGSYIAEINPPVTWSGSTGAPPIPQDYTGAIVIVYGERTLAGMHFPFPPSAIAEFRTPVARNFPLPSEHVPVPTEATSLVPVLTADRITPVADTWAMPYHGNSTSGGAWSGQRIFVHEADVLIFSTVAMEEDQVASQDVKFWLDVAYTYSPPV